MTSNIPASLKSADIGRFAIRAAQVERAKPVIAYWCKLSRQNTTTQAESFRWPVSCLGNFWIVNQIIERGLHTSDEDIKLYTTNLVDKLEQVRQAKKVNTRCSNQGFLTCYGDNSSKAKMQITIPWSIMWLHMPTWNSLHWRSSTVRMQLWGPIKLASRELPILFDFFMDGWRTFY